MNFHSIVRRLFLVFVALLPWSVIISVTGVERFDLEVFRYWKELMLVVFGLYCLTYCYRERDWSIDILDKGIITYTLTLVVVSLFRDTPIMGYAYGLRYDVGFLWAFMIARRILTPLQISSREIFQVFLISGGAMLAASLAVRFVFGEMFLTIFGFSDHVSVWGGVQSAPPIYHGIPGAYVQRFQGLLEGPNQMAFFLLVFIGAYLTTMTKKAHNSFLNFTVAIGVLFLIFLTYSRSGMLGFAVGASFIVLAWLIRTLKTASWKKFFTLRKCLMVLGFISIGIVTIFAFFGSRFQEIFARHGSTSGHYERMHMGFLRFTSQPLGQGLATAGPAARSRFSVSEGPAPTPDEQSLLQLTQGFLEKNPDFVFTTEMYFIPESWFIQQFIEGGIIGGCLFLVVLLMCMVRLRRYPFLVAALLGVCVMNTFLHSFESVHSSLLLFIIIGTCLPHIPRLGK